MLKISPATTVTNVPGDFGKSNNYILYPDSDPEKDIYYALAEFPAFRAEPDGDPSFNLTWYFGSNQESGGICTMTVVLPLPDMSRDDVKAAICKALKRDPAKPPAIKPIDFRSGSVIVQAFENEGAYQSAARGEGQTPVVSTGRVTITPSLSNSNAAVVTFNLKKLGVNLFWHGLGGWKFTEAVDGNDEQKGGASVIAVTYNIDFDGQLRDATAKVTLNKKVTAKLNMEVKQGAWGIKYTQATGKSYDDIAKDAIEIELPVPEAGKPAPSSGDKEKETTTIKKLLTDWANEQLESMVKSQMPEVKLENLNPKDAQKIETLKDMSRTYKLTQAVSIPKHPQGQLPKIDGIAKSNIEKFFRLINLNDTPDFNVDLTVAPPTAANLKAKGVERFVVTKLLYCNEKLSMKAQDGSKQVSTLEYVPPAGTNTSAAFESKTLTGTFYVKAKRTLQYKYLVAYTDGTPSYESPAVTVDDADNYLDLNGVDLGVLSVKLNGADLPWDVISNAKVELEYGDWKKAVTLVKKTGENAPEVSVVKAFGEKMDKKLKYNLTLNLSAGPPIVGDPVEIALNKVGGAEITLKNLAGDRTNIITLELGDGVKRAQLRVEYTMTSAAGPKRVFTNTVTLDDNAKKLNWTVPGYADAPSEFKVTKARVTLADGKPIDLKDLGGGDIKDVQMSNIVTVEKDGLSTF